LNSQTSPELVLPSAADGTANSDNKFSLVVRPAVAQSPKSGQAHVPLPPRDGTTKPRPPGGPHPHSRQAHNEQFTIYVSNLSFKTNEEALEKFFSSGIEKCKAPVSIRLVKDHTTVRCLTFGSVIALTLYKCRERVEVLRMCNSGVKTRSNEPSRPNTTKS